MPQEQEVKSRESRPPREGRGPREGGGGPPRGEGRRDDRRDDRRGDRGFREGPPEIELEKLISDSLYLDNQAHGVVSRMRDMDSGTKSQLRRLYNAVRRAYRAARIAQPGPDRKAAAASHTQERSARLRTVQRSFRGYRCLQRVGLQRVR